MPDNKIVAKITIVLFISCLIFTVIFIAYYRMSNSSTIDQITHKLELWSYLSENCGIRLSNTARCIATKVVNRFGKDRAIAIYLSSSSGTNKEETEFINDSVKECINNFCR